MTWVRVDTGIFRNRKVAAVTPPAKLLYVASLCWAADTLSDGHIPERALATLGAELGIRPRPAARQLVEVGLWEPVEDGWMIPDFTAHNPSRAQVEARRAADRARKQQARQARQGRRDAKPQVSEKRARTAREPRENRARTGRETSSETHANQTRRNAAARANSVVSASDSDAESASESAAYVTTRNDLLEDDEPSAEAKRTTTGDLWAEMARRQLRVVEARGAAPPAGPRRDRWLRTVADGYRRTHADKLAGLRPPQRVDDPTDWLIWRLEPDLAHRDWSTPSIEATARAIDERDADWHAYVASTSPQQRAATARAAVETARAALQQATSSAQEDAS